MTISRLTSKNNPLLKTVRLISSGSRGAPEDLVVAEGVRVLEEVNTCGRQMEAAIVSEDFGAPGREEDLLHVWMSRNVRICRVESRLFKSLSDVQTPQGALALVRIPRFSLDIVPPAQTGLVLFAWGIQDPGNLGTLIRTAAAAGVTLVCTSTGTVSARNRKAIRASAGAFFRIPVIEHAEISEFLRFCKSHEIRLFRTDVRKGLLYTEADFVRPCAILLGNEGGGIADNEFDGIPAVHIPMAQDVESLNVAAAGAILLFEASRQRMNG